MLDLYTKVILTVIAVALTCIAVQGAFPTAHAGDPVSVRGPVTIMGISKGAAECLAAHLTFTGGDKGPCVLEYYYD